MGVAEQMERAIQKTSVSANIKERLDFSCAIFTLEGDLVANAHHFPAMIGSTEFTVRRQIIQWKGRLKAGDVLFSDAPGKFSSLLNNDLTAITPVFDDGNNLIFWTASRGHHADEGAVFKAFLLVRDGKFAEDEVTRIMLEDPAKFPGCSGTRISKFIEEYSMHVVQYYMKAIQDSAELAIKSPLKDVVSRSKTPVLEAVDYMGDGTLICLKVTVNEANGKATFDFTCTGDEVYSNWNTPLAICHSAVIYSLRCMVQSDIPLNQGCINPITILVPPRSMLSPSNEAAVCASNVLTSQCLVDVQSLQHHCRKPRLHCMNNLTFGINGKDGFGYYDTI
ncbi:hypothetical protein OIDMADRAFT_51286 [Oidiodendron maius Zn]|uniref:Hydantoinase B/oxoprolinase domain-containing protein n=1 Tax=Oidiodendron maius (strain Zn) TaxID=913774 RepID=A0A0C3H554_OIDMZ|nr:hypothetical protein OIDMADRAFT_51286 [Oidiodendron maius Zn]